MFSIKKINDVKVRPPQLLTQNKDTRPVKGADMFPEVYSNIFICSKKKSGKSVCIFNILKKCIGKDTTVIIFCSSLYKDPVYKSIMKMLENNGINFIGYTSMYDDCSVSADTKRKKKSNHLEDLVECLKKKAEDDYRKENEEDEEEEKPLCVFDNDEEDEPKQKKKRKSKYVEPEYLIIFDDLSNEIKSPTLTTLLKNHRHYKTKIIISSQYYLDLLPASRTQLDYLLIFQNITEDKLKAMYKDADLDVDYDVFKEMYDYATEKKYNFLYVDTRNCKFRKNFDKEIDMM